MRVAIVGASRYISDNFERDVQQHVNYILDEARIQYGHDLIIVSGGADGVDTIAEEMAKQKDIGTHIYPAEVDQWEDIMGIGRKPRIQ